MNFFKLLITLSLITIAFCSCSEDENVHQECYACANTLTEYCIAEGDDFYTSSINGAATSAIPLNGEYWSDVVAQLESDCDNAPQRDCFTCNDTNSSYCYLDGDDFYTTSVNNATPTETLLDGMSWLDIRFDLEEVCTDVEEDCYTCDSTSAQYCFTEGETFYTSTLNGTDTQIELNGETWSTVRATLESDCPTSQTASIVGSWNLIDFNGVTESTVTVAGQTIETTSTQQGSQYNTVITFTENPNEYVATGSYLNTISTTSSGVTTSQDLVVNPTGDDTGTWEINGSILTVIPNGVTPDEEDVTIIELSNTTFIYRANIDNTSSAGGVTSHSVAETTQTFERQ